MKIKILQESKMLPVWEQNSETAEGKEFLFFYPKDLFLYVSARFKQSINNRS